jgi:hypothetical protein
MAGSFLGGVLVGGPIRTGSRCTTPRSEEQARQQIRRVAKAQMGVERTLAEETGQATAVGETLTGSLAPGSNRRGRSAGCWLQTFGLPPSQKDRNDQFCGGGQAGCSKAQADP